MEELKIIDRFDFPRSHKLIFRIPHYVPISAHLEWNMDGLLDSMWEYLDLIRVYVFIN